MWCTYTVAVHSRKITRKRTQSKLQASTVSNALINKVARRSLEVPQRTIRDARLVGIDLVVAAQNVVVQQSAASVGFKGGCHGLLVARNSPASIVKQEAVTNQRTRGGDQSECALTRGDRGAAAIQTLSIELHGIQLQAKSKLTYSKLSFQSPFHNWRDLNYWDWCSKFCRWDRSPWYTNWEEIYFRQWENSHSLGKLVTIGKTCRKTKQFSNNIEPKKEINM